MKSRIGHRKSAIGMWAIAAAIIGPRRPAHAALYGKAHSAGLTGKTRCLLNHCAALLLLSSFFARPSAAFGQTYTGLIRDPDFARGFHVLAPEGGGKITGHIRPAQSAGPPIWRLAQWHSRFAFTSFTAAANTQAYCVSNRAKWICRQSDAKAVSTLTLGVDTRLEYAGRLRSKPSEPWVHLLVEQAIPQSPALDRIESLRLHLEVRLREANTFKPAGYTPALHAAQFQLVLTLNNSRRDSPGFGDFLWFVIPIYDDRYPAPPEYIARDFAVTRGKLIYNPGLAAVTTNNVRSGGWQTLECELRPWLEKALRTAWAKGYLPGASKLADYRVGSLNVGWEVPGLNRVAMDLRRLSLNATAAQ